MIKSYFSQELVKCLLDALTEIMGREPLGKLIQDQDLDGFQRKSDSKENNRPFDFDAIADVTRALESQYGVSSGHGLALRVGRAYFNRILKTHNKSLGLNTLAFKLLPLPVKLRTGLSAFADFNNTNSSQIIRVEAEPERLLWKIDPCAICWRRKSDQPVCFIMVGFLQEALYWLSGGKTYFVEETECMASGKPECIFIINLRPI